jgi:hypothetical protein
MVARKLLIVTALAETAAGLMLLVSPTLAVAFLLGASLDAPAAFVVGRMAGDCSARSARPLVHRVPAERAGERRRPGEIELLMASVSD